MSKRRWQAWLPNHPGPAIKVKAHDMDAAVEKALAKWRKRPGWDAAVYHPGLQIGVQELVKAADLPPGAEPPSLEIFTLARDRCSCREAAA